MKSAPKAIALSQGKITGSQERSQRRIKEILKSAQHILVTEGFHCLSLRKIAQHMGISNGNVTYYFANKEVLLKALIEDRLTRYDEEFEKEEAKFPHAPDKRITAYFHYLIADAQVQESRSFFYQLWGLSIHSSIAAELRDHVYHHFLSQVLVQLEAARPELNQQELLNRSFLLMSLIEGLNVIFGSSKKFLAQFDDIESILADQVLDIINR